MKKLIQKIKKFFTRVAAETPVVSAVVFKVAEKLDAKQEKEELKQRILNQPQTVQVTEKNLMREGVAAVKRGMRENMHLFGPGKIYNTKDKDGEEHGFDLLSYAGGNNQQRADLIKKTTDLTGQDIKTEAEKAEMIEQRIQHYKQLHKDKEKRELIRNIRHENDPLKRQELESEFHQKFGSKTRSRP